MAGQIKFPLYYLDTCIISNLVKDPSDRPEVHEQNMEAMRVLILRCEFTDFVMSPQALAEFQRDKDKHRSCLKAEIYDWMDNVSAASKNLLLIPVFSDEGRLPMLPIYDPYDPPRPPGSPPLKLPEGVRIPERRIIGYDIMFYDVELLKQLKEIFDPADAEHVYQAVKGGCQCFVTVDQSSILDRIPPNKVKLDEICPGMRFLSPVEVLTMIEAL